MRETTVFEFIHSSQMIYRPMIRGGSYLLFRINECITSKTWFYFIYLRYLLKLLSFISLAY